MELRKPISNRKNEQISKKKLLNMVNLFEKVVDATISNINIGTNIITTTNGDDYWVNLKENYCMKSYPDPEY